MSLLERAKQLLLPTTTTTYTTTTLSEKSSDALLRRNEETSPTPAQPPGLRISPRDVRRNEESQKSPPPYAQPWPDALPGLGPRAIGSFAVCDPCHRAKTAPPAGSWVRYGGEVVCLPHALAMSEEAVPIVARMVAKLLAFGGLSELELSGQLDLSPQTIARAVDYLRGVGEIIELEDGRWALVHASHSEACDCDVCVPPGTEIA